MVPFWKTIWHCLVELNILTPWVCVCCAQLFVTPWTVALQVPLSMGFPSKNTGMGCHFLLQGIFPTRGPNLGLLCLQRSQAHSCSRSSVLILEAVIKPPGKLHNLVYFSLP